MTRRTRCDRLWQTAMHAQDPDRLQAGGGWGQRTRQVGNERIVRRTAQCLHGTLKLPVNLPPVARIDLCLKAIHHLRWATASLSDLRSKWNAREMLLQYGKCFYNDSGHLSGAVAMRTESLQPYYAKGVFSAPSHLVVRTNSTAYWCSTRPLRSRGASNCRVNEYTDN